MLFPILFTALLSTTASMPTEPYAPPPPEPYNCGYTLFNYDYNMYVGLSALDSCVMLYYNHTLRDYQPAIAYHIHGRCECKFFETMDSCKADKHAPIYTGPTDADMGKSLKFKDPKPKVYNCVLQKQVTIDV